MTRWSFNHNIYITRERNSWFRNDRPAKIWDTKERPYIQNESLCNVLRLMLRKTQMIRTIPPKMKWKKVILMKLLRRMKIQNFSMFKETADTARCHSESMSRFCMILRHQEVSWLLPWGPMRKNVGPYGVFVLLKEQELAWRISYFPATLGQRTVVEDMTAFLASLGRGRVESAGEKS